MGTHHCLTAHLPLLTRECHLQRVPQAKNTSTIFLRNAPMGEPRLPGSQDSCKGPMVLSLAPHPTPMMGWATYGRPPGAGLGPGFLHALVPSRRPSCTGTLASCPSFSGWPLSRPTQEDIYRECGPLQHLQSPQLLSSQQSSVPRASCFPLPQYLAPRAPRTKRWAPTSQACTSLHPVLVAMAHLTMNADPADTAKPDQSGGDSAHWERQR